VGLHPYQRIAVDHLHRNPRAGLFLDMGLGKTAITLSALTPEHLPALVVAPKRVAEHVWPVEAAKWRPDLSMSLAAGPPAQRAAALTTRADVAVLGRDNLGDAERIARRFKTVVWDELSGYKGRGVRWKQARRISKDREHVWGLTGTPAPNGLLDLWAQLYLLDQGARLGSGITGYRERYFRPGYRLPNGIITEWILREGADKRIYGLIEDICLSMVGEGRIQLPSVTYNIVAVPLPGPVMKVYKTFLEDLVADMEVLGGEIHSADNAAILTAKLSQITAGFCYVDEADVRGGAFDWLHDEKINAVKEIVEGTGSPVLVFYRFLPERDRLHKELPGAQLIDDEGAIERWNQGQVPVLLAHPASAGHGLNLQYGGHTIVWPSLPWDLELWQQGNGRLLRQGQEHPVVIHTLESPGTVDPRISRRLQGKADVQTALRDHLESLL
jgi:SNF2 family DNA or RNA helicase